MRAIAEEAYAARRALRRRRYRDRWVRRALVDGGADETLGGRRRGWCSGIEGAAEVGAADIGISGGSDADVFEGLDPTGWPAPAAAGSTWRGCARDRRQVAWSIVAYPTERWAVETLGEPDVERLWHAVAHVMRLDEPDPAASWSVRLDELEARARALTEARLRQRALPRPRDRPRGRADRGRALDGRPRAHRRTARPTSPTSRPRRSSPARTACGPRARSAAPMPLALRGDDRRRPRVAAGGRRIVDVQRHRGADARPRRPGHRRRRAPLRRGRAGRRLLARGRDRGHLPQHAVRRERRPHIAWGRASLAARPTSRPTEHAAAGLNASATHTDFMVGSRRARDRRDRARRRRRCRSCATGASGSCRPPSALRLRSRGDTLRSGLEGCAPKHPRYAAG